MELGFYTVMPMVYLCSKIGTLFPSPQFKVITLLGNWVLGFYTVMPMVYLSVPCSKIGTLIPIDCKIFPYTCLLAFCEITILGACLTIN